MPSIARKGVKNPSVDYQLKSSMPSQMGFSRISAYSAVPSLGGIRISELNISCQSQTSLTNMEGTKYDSNRKCLDLGKRFIDGR